MIGPQQVCFKVFWGRMPRFPMDGGKIEDNLRLGQKIRRYRLPYVMPNEDCASGRERFRNRSCIAFRTRRVDIHQINRILGIGGKQRQRCVGANKPTPSKNNE
jgi:hypothetical protein